MNRPATDRHPRKRFILAVVTGVVALIAAPFIAIAILSNARKR